MDRPLRRVCVYCASSNHVHDDYKAAAYDVGKGLAERGIGVVYGGGSVGLMNEVAQGALDAGGEVIGVIPQKLLDLEVGRKDLTELHVVAGMHPRKLAMAELSDAFIALPGGYGTLEELFEVTTWTQLNYHHKPVGLLDVRGYWTHLVAFLDHAAAEGFVRPVHRPLIQHHNDLDALIDGLRTAVIPEIGTWIKDV